jgi:hypothetical protein
LTWLVPIFCLLVAAAGWFYMFYSQAAANLVGVEGGATNRLRVRLRRVGGLAMILLAITFYLGSVAIERQQRTAALACLLMVVMLMVIIVVLGLVDLRLTHKIRRP